MTGVPFDWTTPIVHSELTRHEVWLGCAGIGGDITMTQLADIIEGRRDATAFEHNVLAQTLNERFHDLGQSWPIPYRD